jgi:ribosomal protein S12 methylthiotransferase accessory factor
VPSSHTDRLTYDEIGSVRHESLADDLHTTVAGVLASTGRSPLIVDHTRHEVGIPVVRVVCPGLEYDPALL